MIEIEKIREDKKTSKGKKFYRRENNRFSFLYTTGKRKEIKDEKTGKDLSKIHKKTIGLYLRAVWAYFFKSPNAGCCNTCKGETWFAGDFCAGETGAA